MSVRMSFNCNVSPFRFCPDDLFIVERGKLKQLTTTVLWTVCGFISNSRSSMKLGTIVFDISMFRIPILSW